MSDSVTDEPLGPETTGTYQYQELIDSRLGQPIANFVSEDETARIAASPGLKLAAARSAMGWSVEHVAAQLKLAPRQIVAIESDDYAQLPERAIVRGFIRAYAKLLKLDAAALIALLPADRNDREAVSSGTRASSIVDKKSLGWPFKIALIILGVLAFSWLFLY